MAATPDDTFDLYDLSVEVILRPGGHFVCGHVLGACFKVVGEDLVFGDGLSFSLYAMSALLPLLPGMQRANQPYDWMTPETDVACPDPNCGAIFRISRTGRSRFSRATATQPQ